MNGKFILGTGLEIDGGRSIVPLIGMKSDDIPIFLGTAFFISPPGAILVTAKHCLFDSGTKPWKDLAICQFFEDKTYILRPIREAYWNSSDVAILVPRELNRKSTGERVRNPVPTLAVSYPTAGTPIASFAYPSSIMNIVGEKQIKLSVNDTWHFGQIEDFHPEGTPMLRNPCFQASMEIKGGSSGGPVANQQGQIFAINSTGAETTPEIAAYSFLSPIDLCFDIHIDITIDGERRLYPIRELINYKFIPVFGVNT